MGQMITLKAEDGHSFGAYRAAPAGKPKAGIVVIQEIFGVNHHIKNVSDGLAADGYVTGLEPGTNFPNPRSFEGQQGRVVKLGPGETVKFEVELDVHGDAAAVATAEAAVKKIQSRGEPKVFTKPEQGWTKT